jgi:hypothetical protein
MGTLRNGHPLRIVRPPKAKFKFGDRVWVNCDYTGGYFGVVTEIVPRLTKSRSSQDETLDTRPGVHVKVDWWDGSPIDYDMAIEVWDDETELATTRPNHPASAKPLSFAEWEETFA